MIEYPTFMIYLSITVSVLWALFAGVFIVLTLGSTAAWEGWSAAFYLLGAVVLTVAVMFAAFACCFGLFVVGHLSAAGLLRFWRRQDAAVFVT